MINRGRTTSNADGGGSVTVIHTYKDLNATIANIIMSFPDYLGNGANQDMVFVGDHMLIEGSDTTNLRAIESLAPFTMGPNLFQDAVPSLSVGAPVAATDGNAAKITGTVLQMQYADGSNPGILSVLPQNIAGEKTFQANVIISQPDTGLLIEKDAGNFGQQFETGDPGATVAIDFSYTAQPADDFSIKYSYEGFTESAPQIGIFAKNFVDPADNWGLVIDNGGDELARVFIQNAEFYVDEMFPYPSNSITVNTWRFIDDRLDFPNSGASIDIFRDPAPTSISYVFDSGDYFAYDVSSDTYSWVIGGVSQFAIDTTSGLKTDVGLDRITAGTLNLGTTNATAIHLAQDTSLPAGKILTTNSLDTTSESDLLIGANNATGILLQQPTELPAGKTLTANGGIIFQGGGSNLNDYERISMDVDFTNGALNTGSVQIDLTRIGTLVTITCRTDVTTGAQGSPGTGFYANGVIPPDFRIASGAAYAVSIVKNDASTYSVSHVATDPVGNLILSANLDGTSTFTAGVSNTVKPFSITYTIEPD